VTLGLVRSVRLMKTPPSNLTALSNSSLSTLNGYRVYPNIKIMENFRHNILFVFLLNQGSVLLKQTPRPLIRRQAKLYSFRHSLERPPPSGTALVVCLSLSKCDSGSTQNRCLQPERSRGRSQRV
jgi:hypothetical protein